MDRKEFLKSGLLACTAGATGIALFLESCKKSNTGTSAQGPTVNFTLDLSQSANSALKTAGGSLSTQGVVVAYDGSSYFAVAQACTHQGCSVSYNNPNHTFVCPCHGAVFSQGGAAKSGPVSIDLKSYTCTLNGNILTVAG